VALTEKTPNARLPRGDNLSYDNLRTDPRIAALRQRVGLP
jgi:hypothetical protein